MPLDDPRIDRLIALIKDSFRVERNSTPDYVDISGHLARVAAPQHQVIYGRRGSGKSCLLVTARKNAEAERIPCVYIVADEIKRLSYPDVLIRLLLGIFEQIAQHPGGWRARLFRRPSPLTDHIRALRELLEQAESSQIQSKAATETSAGLQVGGDYGKVSLSGVDQAEENRQFTRRKLDTLDRHLQDYKSALEKALKQTRAKRALVIIDDFYLIHREVQPDVVDYLHRLLRGTNASLKLGTIRHRTKLARTDGQFIGIEPTQDVEVINLDLTFEDMKATTEFLRSLLNSFGQKVGIAEVAGNEYLNDEALFALTLSSAGVPRDFLAIFVNAVQAARNERSFRWLTPTYVYRGAGRVSYQEKIANLQSDAGPESRRLELVLSDVLTFCLKEKRKTAFLLSQDDVGKHAPEHDLIEQLMDFKLIHVVAPDTSAASGRPGRYEAYTLDAALFMEPRRRYIEVVKFWETDDQRRPVNLREAPDYPLSRIAELSDLPVAPEDLLEQVDKEAPPDTQV